MMHARRTKPSASNLRWGQPTRAFLPLALPGALLGTLLLLASCVTVQTPTQSEPSAFKEEGMYVTPVSGFRLPPLVEGFHRDQITFYDQEGRDVGVAYNSRTPRVALTIFIYPAPAGPRGDLQTHLESCKGEVLNRHAGARLIDESRVRIQTGDVARYGFHSSFEFPDVLPARSDLFLFQHKNWFVKYRATYPAGSADEAEPALRRFMERWTWPG